MLSYKLEKYSNGEKTLYVVYMNLESLIGDVRTENIYIFHDPELCCALNENEYGTIFKYNRPVGSRLHCGLTNRFRECHRFSSQLCLFNMDMGCVSIMVKSLSEAGYKPIKKLCKKLHLT